MRPGWLALTLWLCLGGRAYAQDPLAAEPQAEALVLDERRVVELALADSPSLEVAHDEARAADLTRHAATLGLLPDLQVVGRYTRLSNVDAKYRSLNGFTFPQVLNQAGVRAQLVVPVSRMLLDMAANVRALGHAAAARALEEEAARARVAYEARAAFLRYWRARIGLASALELESASALQLADQRARLAAGAVSPNDVLSFELARDAAVLAAHAARKEVVSAEAGLRRLVRSADVRPLALRDVDDPGPRTRPPADVSGSPRLRAMEEEAEAARESAEAASQERLPKLSLYALGDYSGPSPRVIVARDMEFLPIWEAGARLEWSLSQLVGGGVLAERARVQHHQLRARVEELRRTLESERGAATAGLAITEQRIEQARERETRARTLAEARRNELRAGTALPLNVIVAESELARAQNELADALAERALAFAELDFLAGVSLPSSAAGAAP